MVDLPNPELLLSAFGADDAVLIDGRTGAPVTRAEITHRAVELAEAAGGYVTEPPATTPRIANTRAESAHHAAIAGSAPALAFLLATNTLGVARDFHALIAAGIPVALIDATADPATIAALVDRYTPELVLADAGSAWAHDEYTATAPGTWVARAPRRAEVHPDLAVLLTTSGSTGSPKFVRLSAGNVAANACQISASLGLRTSDVGVTALPIHYSFGMSVLTSHAAAGSPVVVTAASVLEPALWQHLAEHRVSFLPGVPQTYQMLRRLGLADRDLPHLRALIQAGGRLDPALVTHFSQVMADRGGEFFVMYGQTEASPRIACLPPARLSEKLGAAGIAVPGARLSIRGPQGDELPAGEAGEVFFTGPNVMMGYAEQRADLALGDATGDTLATGDLGYLDPDGYLYLTGRSKRIAKVAGLRISLDEVEALSPELAAAAVEVPAGTITLATATAGTEQSRTAEARALAKLLRVPPKHVRVRVVEELPLLPSGKVDYRRLAAQLDGADPAGS